MQTVIYRFTAEDLRRAGRPHPKREGRSRFSLSTLPAADFPNLDDWQSEVEFTLPQATMKRLIEATQFSMAHQDVRYYLNGMLFETEGEELRTVATDGHRLAVCSMPIGQSLPSHSVIVPRKGVIELMRMLDGGCDPRYIARRLMRMSVEDIGLADPRAMDVAVNAAEIYERLGSPEGDLALGEAAVYLACAPKSNAIEVAMNELKDFIRSDGSRPVPMHLRNAPTKLMKDLGYKEGYRYAHDEPGAFAAGEIYLPEGLEGRRWYHPTDRGTEARIAEKLRGLAELNQAAWKAGKGRRRGQG